MSHAPIGPWQDLDYSVEALAIFSGPQHYITPSWYRAKRKIAGKCLHGIYVVVHAYGSLQAIEDADWLMTHLEQLTTHSEAGASVLWKVSDAPIDFIRSQIKESLALSFQ